MHVYMYRHEHTHTLYLDMIVVYYFEMLTFFKEVFTVTSTRD